LSMFAFAVFRCFSKEEVDECRH